MKEIELKNRTEKKISKKLYLLIHKSCNLKKLLSILGIDISIFIYILHSIR